MSKIESALVAMLEAAGWSDARVERVLEGCRAYVALLLRHNRGANLIGPLDADEAMRALVMDALLPGLVVPPSGALLDVGSGAGLPGLPLALAWPDVPMTLVEPRRKRATFIGIAARRLGLSNVEVIAARLEHVDAARRWGTVASKAFQPPVQWVETAKAHTHAAPEGLAYLYLSDEAWSPEARARAAALGWVEAGRQEHPLMPGRFGLALRLEADAQA